MDKAAWTSALKQAIQAQRQAKPVLARTKLTPEQEWECRIVEGEFLSWYEQDLRKIIGERIAQGADRFDPDPTFVLTTNRAGLVALAEMLPEPPDNLVYLLHTDFKTWLASHPADTSTFYVHHWSFFEPLTEELQAQAKQAFPQVDPATFRLHQVGDQWEKQGKVVGKHLWQWDGKEMQLLAEAFVSNV